jgi:hypothetical protein
MEPLSEREQAISRTVDSCCRPALPHETTKQGTHPVPYCGFKDCNYSSSTYTNIKGHLRTKHKVRIGNENHTRADAALQLHMLLEDLDLRTRPDLQTTIFETVLNKDLIRQCLVRLIIQQRLPFRFVESSAFHALVQALNPAAAQFVPLSHNTIRQEIFKYWTTQKDLLQKEIQTAISNINIALDLWTSPNRILFMATTV